LVQRDAVTDVDGHPKLESRTAYLGFNPDAGQEAAKLKAKPGDKALISLSNADERANLAKPEDITWFVGRALDAPTPQLEVSQPARRHRYSDSLSPKQSRRQNRRAGEAIVSWAGA
jgi:hypothetical protein